MLVLHIVKVDGECDSICRKKDGQSSPGLGYCNVKEHCTDGRICCFIDENGNRRFDIDNNKYYGVCVQPTMVGVLPYCPGDPYIPAAKKFLEGDLGGAIVSAAEITVEQVKKGVEKVKSDAANTQGGQETVEAAGNLAPSTQSSNKGSGRDILGEWVEGAIKLANPVTWR